MPRRPAAPPYQPQPKATPSPNLAEALLSCIQATRRQRAQLLQTRFPLSCAHNRRSVCRVHNLVSALAVAVGRTNGRIVSFRFVSHVSCRSDARCPGCWILIVRFRCWVLRDAACGGGRETLWFFIYRGLDVGENGWAVLMIQERASKLSSGLKRHRLWHFYDRGWC